MCLLFFSCCSLLSVETSLDRRCEATREWKGKAKINKNYLIKFWCRMATWSIVFVRFNEVRVVSWMNTKTCCHGVGCVNNTLDLLSDEFHSNFLQSAKLHRFTAHIEAVVLIKTQSQSIVAFRCWCWRRWLVHDKHPRAFFNPPFVSVAKINSSKHRSLINR